MNPPLPCQVDPTSLTGLRRLVRENPGTWDALIDRPYPASGADLSESTIAEVLRSGLVHDLLPHWSNDAGRLRRARACAGRLVRAVGDRAIADVDDDFVEALRLRLVDPEAPALDRPLAASTAGRTLSLLRTAARLWAMRCGRTPGVSDRPVGPRHRVGDRRVRHVPSLYLLAELLEVVPDWLRAAIGLAFGAGLSQGEIRLLRRGHLHCPAHRIILFGNRPGLVKDPVRVRYAWVPPWVRDLLEELHPALHRLPPGAFLFASPLDLRRPRGELNAALRRACRDAWGEDGPTFTFGDLRRSWQALCRGHRLPHAVVRQSWWVLAPPPGSAPRLPPGVLQLERVIGSWRQLGDPVADPLRVPQHVPRAAAKNTGPWQPEPAGRRARRWSPMPKSCLLEPVRGRDTCSPPADDDDWTDR